MCNILKSIGVWIAYWCLDGKSCVLYVSMLIGLLLCGSSIPTCFLGQQNAFFKNLSNSQSYFLKQIRSFPSGEFYAESLEDGPNVKDQTRRSWHDHRCFGPFCFFDLHEGKESQPSGSGSWVNVDEVEFVFLLYQKLVSTYPELKSSQQFAIISPYSAQVNLFKERFKSTFGVNSEKVVDITTVDGCQVKCHFSLELVYWINEDIGRCHVGRSG